MALHNLIFCRSILKIEFMAFRYESPVWVSVSGVTWIFSFSFLLTVDSEQVTSLGSDGEDELGLWCLEPQDCQETLDKRSLTPSEGTEEPGSPARSMRPHSLSPGSRNYWAHMEPEAEAAEEASALSTSNREGDQEPLTMSCKYHIVLLEIF